MRRQLKAVPGVKDVVVDFNSKQAEVVVVEGTPTQALLDGLEGQYSATVSN